MVCGFILSTSKRKIILAALQKQGLNFAKINCAKLSNFIKAFFYVDGDLQKGEKLFMPSCTFLQYVKKGLRRVEELDGLLKLIII